MRQQWRSVRRRWPVVVAAPVLVLAAACGDDDDEGGAPDDGGPDASGATLEITAIEYDDVSAPAGGTLEIVNSSGAPHTFTADDESFDVSDIGDGDTVTADVPDEPGEYPFHCEIHPSMRATLTAE
ncbi:MAG TPA: cupredoxin domain-containing protein [Acidimicrobiales bacterium]